MPSFVRLKPGETGGVLHYSDVRPGMAVVCEAVPQLAQRVALRILLPELQVGEVILRFQREARLCQLESRGARLDADTLPDLPYIVMEFLDGTIWPRTGCPWIVARWQAINYTCCRRAARWRKRIGSAPFDLKPSNLFLVTEGRQTIVKVVDLNSKVADDGPVSRITRTDAALGTALVTRIGKRCRRADGRLGAGVVLFGCSPRIHHSLGIRQLGCLIVADKPRFVHASPDVPPISRVS